MRLSLSLPLLTLLTTASAFDWDFRNSLLSKRAITFDTLLADFANLTNQTADLGVQVYNLDSILGAIGLNTGSTGVQAALNKSIDDANAMPMMDNNQALKLIIPVQKLNFATNVTLTNFINKRPFFVNNGLAMIVYQGLSLQNLTSYQLNDAIAAKTPPESRGNSATLSAPATNSLARALSAYAKNGTGDPSLLPAVDKASAANGRYVPSYVAAGAVAFAMAAML